MKKIPQTKKEILKMFPDLIGMEHARKFIMQEKGNIEFVMINHTLSAHVRHNLRTEKTMKN